VSQRKKRKQHYVWEHYLSGWASGCQLWCRHGGRRFKASTNDVAQERDFYRLQEITDADLAFVERIAIAGTDPLLQPLAREWIAPFHHLFVRKREYERQGRRLPDFESRLEIAINNVEEDLHAYIESAAVPILADLRAAQVSFMGDDESAIDFVRFIAAQYTRTPTIKHASVGALRGVPGVNVEATWGLLRTIFASNMGYAFFRRRHGLRTTFLRAAAGTEFITGDQPMVNTKAVGKAANEAATELELYYPLSPELAVLFDFDGEVRSTTERQLEADEVSAFNAMIEGRSYRQVYAASETTLATLKEATDEYAHSTGETSASPVEQER